MTFWQFLWLMVWGMFFILYLMIMFQVIVDVFRDDSMSGWAKAAWLVALFILPVLTLLIYVIARGEGMTRRQATAAKASRAATEDYIRSVAGTDATNQIANAKSLLDSGAITAAEFEQLKAKALA